MSNYSFADFKHRKALRSIRTITEEVDALKDTDKGRLTLVCIEPLLVEVVKYLKCAHQCYVDDSYKYFKKEVDDDE